MWTSILLRIFQKSRIWTSIFLICFPKTKIWIPYFWDYFKNSRFGLRIVVLLCCFKNQRLGVQIRWICPCVKMEAKNGYDSGCRALPKVIIWHNYSKHVAEALVHPKGPPDNSNIEFLLDRGLSRRGDHPINRTPMNRTLIGPILMGRCHMLPRGRDIQTVPLYYHTFPQGS